MKPWAFFLAADELRALNPVTRGVKPAISPTVLGILLSATAYLFFTCFDTASKFLARDYSVFQIMSVQFVTATVLLVLFALLKNRNNPELQTLVMNRPSLHLLRGIAQILGQSLVFLAIPHLSLAEFYVIIFCMPIITVLKVGWFLKERPAAFIWPVLAVNFLGVLIALRPDQGMNFWALVALAGTVLLASSLVVLRKMMEAKRRKWRPLRGVRRSRWERLP